MRSTSASENPHRKKLSAPTSSRISTLAPSSVPMVSAPLIMNFVFPVPRGFLARCRDLFRQIGRRVDQVRA